MTDLDWYDGIPDARIVPTPRKHRHRWIRLMPIVPEWDGPEPEYHCMNCGAIRDEIRARRGRQSRNYGNRAELAVARKYGGEKIGAAGGPVDVRGADFNVQVKTHRRQPPREWTKSFNAMSANRERIPRLLLRFVMGVGVPPQDYFVIQAEDWLRWYGKDEETA